MRAYRVFFTVLLCALVTMPVTVAGARSPSATANLTFSLWDKNQMPAMQQIINGFEKQYPNVHVTIQQTPWAGYWNKLATLTAGGASWDVTGVKKL